MPFFFLLHYLSTFFSTYFLFCLLLSFFFSLLLPFLQFSSIYLSSFNVYYLFLLPFILSLLLPFFSALLLPRIGKNFQQSHFLSSSLSTPHLSYTVPSPIYSFDLPVPSVTSPILPYKRSFPTTTVLSRFRLAVNKFN